LFLVHILNNEVVSRVNNFVANALQPNIRKSYFMSSLTFLNVYYLRLLLARLLSLSDLCFNTVPLLRHHVLSNRVTSIVSRSLYSTSLACFSPWASLAQNDLLFMLM